MNMELSLITGIPKYLGGSVLVFALYFEMHPKAKVAFWVDGQRDGWMDT